jgi:hypothetical protein
MGEPAEDAEGTDSVVAIITVLLSSLFTIAPSEALVLGAPVGILSDSLLTQVQDNMTAFANSHTARSCAASHASMHCH